jgi:hypothetical protein
VLLGNWSRSLVRCTGVHSGEDWGCRAVRRSSRRVTRLLARQEQHVDSQIETSGCRRTWTCKGWRAGSKSKTNWRGALGNTTQGRCQGQVWTSCKGVRGHGLCGSSGPPGTGCGRGKNGDQRRARRGAQSRLQVRIRVRVFPVSVCQCGLGLSLCAVPLLHLQVPGASSGECKLRKQ